MKYLILGLDVFLKKMALGLLLVVQLTLSIGLMNLMLAFLNTQQVTQRLFEPFSTEQGVYVMPSSEYRWNEKGGTGGYLPRFLSELHKVKRTVQIDQYSLSAGGYSDLLGLAYDDLLWSTLTCRCKREAS